MSDTLFDLEDFEETITYLPRVFPPRMFACGVHEQINGGMDHVSACWGGSCPSCGEVVTNDLLLGMNHSGADDGVCISTELRLRHLTNALRNGEPPSENDMTAIDRGWRVGPDGSHVPPAGVVLPRWYA